jgi:transcriptional regulator with XRE-family HTH domain
LIGARIAAELTQQALATLLGLKEQQLQRYAGVRLPWIQTVANALGARITERVLLPSSAKH